MPPPLPRLLPAVLAALVGFGAALRAQQPETPPPPLDETFQPAAPLPSPTPPVAPRQSRFRLVLQGAAHFDKETILAALADQVEEIEQYGLTPALADDTAFFLAVFYRKHGYSQVVVSGSLLPGNTLLLCVREGPLTRLGSVIFEGNQLVSTKTLFETLVGSTTERLPRGEKKIPFVEADIKSGVDRVRSYYQSEGFLDSQVGDAVITLAEGGARADVVVPVHEGIQYRFGPITFQGDVLFFPITDLERELKVFTDKPYTPLGVTNIERKVLYYYRSRGYFLAKVKAESNPAEAVGGEVPVRISINAGDVYRFDGITVRGLERLRPRFLENRFKRLRGRPYNPEAVERRYRTLMGTGLFSELRIKQVPLPNHEVRLDFNVKEAKSHEVGFSIGYGTLEGAIVGTRYTDRNLLGLGRPLSINAEVAQNLLRGEVAYTDPWLFDTNYTLRLRLYGLSQTFDDYSKAEYGFRGEVVRKVGRRLEVSTFILARYVAIDNFGGIEPQELGPSRYFANSLGVTLTLDYRDSVLSPTRGWVITASTDAASSLLGSSIGYLRGTGRVSYYLPLWKTLLAVGLRGGVIVPTESGELPIDERFFNGGSRSVRSYVDRSLGPKDRFGHSIGGQTFTTFNIEDNFPIYENLQGAVFFDAGSVGRTLGDGLGITGYAVGVGLRYKTPVGPLRIDYGFNPVRKANEPVGAWNFSFGFAF